MKLTLKIAKILKELAQGEVIANSKAPGKLIEHLVEDGILYRQGKHRKTLQLIDEEGLEFFLENQLQIKDLDEFIAAQKNEGLDRSDSVRLTTDSKFSRERVFQGFLINCCDPIEAKLNGKPLILSPPEGSFTFIHNFKDFQIPEDITIVGMENTANFREIRKQKHLFPNKNPLFISRYPQTQHKDVLRWLGNSPNNYLHFGDFDFAGIGIYLNEYKLHLKEKASFFIPETVENDLKNHGNRQRFDRQNLNFNPEKISEIRLKNLFELIRKEKKGLDQEFYIGSY